MIFVWLGTVASQNACLSLSLSLVARNKKVKRRSTNRGGEQERVNEKIGDSVCGTERIRNGLEPREVEGSDPPPRGVSRKARFERRTLARVTLSRGPKQTCRMAIRELNVHRGWFTAR